MDERPQKRRETNPNGSAPSRQSGARVTAPDGGPPPEDPVESARAAGLRHVMDEKPGIYRHRRGKGWSYHGPDGTLIRDPAVRERIEALAIPPAWKDVWICPHPDGHIQATGRDDRGRKQYRYHPRWREVRNATKFHRMIRFGESLPRLRARVEADLRRRGLEREKVLATVVRLLETTCIRVGNEQYKRENGTFGLTTMRNRHVELRGSEVRFRFEGKGGKEQEVSLTDRRLARIVRECRETSGYELFQYLDADGERRVVDSGDVNDYLREISGEDYTAKDFRTWVGSVHAFSHLCRVGAGETEKEIEARALAAVDYVADQLRNTRAVCREFYIHPGVLRSYEEGWLCRLFTEEHMDELVAGLDSGSLQWLDPAEVGLLELLREVDRQQREETSGSDSDGGPSEGKGSRAAA